MKKLVLLFAFILPLMFSGCSNDDDNGDKDVKTLDGTVWEYQEKVGVNEVAETFTFGKSIVESIIIRKIDENKDGAIQDNEIGVTEYKGTYTYNDPTVILEIGGKKATYTVSGDKMTLVPSEGGDPIVYVKK